MGDPIKSYLMRPVLSDPPLCGLVDLKSTLTIDDLADMHEALNVKEANLIKSREKKNGRN